MNQNYFIKKTFELAKKGWGKTNPNPLVGAVIVKNNKIIAEGYHTALGQPHAEVEALRHSVEDVRNATLYVNLEPCTHYGKTPPCVNAIIKAGIKEVFIAMLDPNPIVAGKGIQLLKEAGIKTTVGILENEAKKLNEIFIKFITGYNPFVIMKTAMTLDGKIASTTGDSKWITGTKAREYVHFWRNRVMAIMVGVNTVIKDNPLLTSRMGQTGKNPIRIIVDSTGRTPLESFCLDKKSGDRIILATTSRMQKSKQRKFQEKGVELIITNNTCNKVSLVELMKELRKMQIDSVLLEGGGTLNASALDQGIVDKVMMFIAPKFIGGNTAKTPIEGKGILLMKDAISLKNIELRQFDNDILIEGYT